MLDEEPTPGGLVPVPAVRAGKFHTAHKLTLMVHNPKHYTEMGASSRTRASEIGTN
jgi:hypothetical protein